MEKKVLTLVTANILLVPCFLALITESLGYILFALAYGTLLILSAKYDNRVMKFWKSVLRIALELSNKVR